MNYMIRSWAGRAGDGGDGAGDMFRRVQRISGFRHIMGKLEVNLTERIDAESILELVRFANVEAQKPLVEEELLFICHTRRLPVNC